MLLKSLNKSQVSFFVIIGVIILLGSIGLYVFKGDSSILNNDEFEDAIKIDSENDEAVHNFLTSCIKEETKSGLKKLGLNGGWLYKPNNIMYASSKDYNLLIKDKQGFETLGDIKHVYWRYFDDSNSKFVNQVPSFNDEGDDFSIKNQLQRYLKENLQNKCFKQLEKFDKMYEIEYDIEELKTNVIFQGDFVYVENKINMDIKDLSSDKKFSYDTFNIKEFNQMKRPFFHALAILDAQVQYSFFDTRAWQFLQAYQTKKNRDALPPTSSFAFGEFDFDAWEISKVKDLSQNILATNTYYFKFKNSSNEWIETPEELKDNQLYQGLYSMYYKDYLGDNNSVVLNLSKYNLDPKDFSKDSVKVNYYQFYPMYFEISNSIGNQILLPKADSFMGIFPIFWTSYSALYQITTPFVLEIKSDYNSGEDFVLNVAFEVNIRDSEPLIDEEQVNFEIEEEFADLNVGGDTNPGTLICNPSQRISKKVSFNITDPIKNSGIDEGIVEFNCKNLTTCFIGKTKESFEYQPNVNVNHLVTVNKSLVELRLPINCDNGEIRVFKPGYETLTIKGVSPSLENELNLGEFEMSSSKDIGVKVKKKLNNGGTLSDNQYDENESIVVLFQHKTNEEFVRVVEQNKSNMNVFKNISLIPGEYEVRAFALTEKNFTIPEEKICYRPNPLASEKCETIPAVDLESWVTGGIGRNLTLSVDDFKNLKTLTVNIVNIEIPQTFSQLQEQSDMISEALQINDNSFYDITLGYI